MTASAFEILTTYRHAWLAATFLGVACALVGVHVVLRRIAFVGIATAQIGAAGVALAFLLGLSPSMLALGAVLLGLAALGTGREPRRVPRDALVAVAFVAASATTVLFVSRSGAELDQVEHIVYGNLLFATNGQVRLLAALAAAVLVLHALLGRAFLQVAVDRDAARALRLPVRALDAALYATLGVVVAFSIGVAGSVLAFAFLIVPPAVGLLLAHRFARVAGIALATAALSAPLGTALSVLLDLPTGPTVVAAVCAVLLLAAAWRLHPAAFPLALALLGAGLYALRPAPHPSQAEASPDPAAAAPQAAAALHVDLELTAHDIRVHKGEPLAIDYVVRIAGEAPPDLHLEIDVADAVESVPLLGVRRRTAGRVEIDTSDLEPGRYDVGASLWRGDPLDPTPTTELLPPDVCAARTPQVEVLP